MKMDIIIIIKIVYKVLGLKFRTRKSCGSPTTISSGASNFIINFIINGEYLCVCIYHVSLKGEKKTKN